MSGKEAKNIYNIEKKKETFERVNINKWLLCE